MAAKSVYGSHSNAAVKKSKKNEIFPKAGATEINLVFFSKMKRYKDVLQIVFPVFLGVFLTISQ